MNQQQREKGALGGSQPPERIRKGPAQLISFFYRLLFLISVFLFFPLDHSPWVEEASLLQIGPALGHTRASGSLFFKTFPHLLWFWLLLNQQGTSPLREGGP